MGKRHRNPPSTSRDDLKRRREGGNGGGGPPRGPLQPPPPPPYSHAYDGGRPSDESDSSSAVDDTKGHFPTVPGRLIDGRYEVVSELGTGTFGKVFECHDHKHGDKVAVKVVRSIKRYVESARIESAVLNAVYDRQRRDRVDFCVKMYSAFTLGDHYCLVCEALGMSLYDLVKRNEYAGLPLRHVREVARQLLQAMDFLESMRLIHTDLKLENVLFHRSDVLETHTVTLRDGRSAQVVAPQDLKIKIIDFGGATFDDEHKSTIVNTRQYRGPEVTLEAGWSYPSDIWSVGCIVAEAYAGDMFFATHDELEHLALMERALGRFPSSLLDRSPPRVERRYFDRSGHVRTGELTRESQDYVRDAPGVREFFSLRGDDPVSGIVDVMYALFELEPRRRATARQALAMPFFRDHNGRSNGHHGNGSHHPPRDRPSTR